MCGVLCDRLASTDLFSSLVMSFLQSPLLLGINYGRGYLIPIDESTGAMRHVALG